jgi:hypothetical protein
MRNATLETMKAGYLRKMRQKEEPKVIACLYIVLDLAEGHQN